MMCASQKPHKQFQELLRRKVSVQELSSNTAQSHGGSENNTSDDSSNSSVGIVALDDDNDALVKRLIELDQLEDVATLKNMPNFFDDASGDLTARLRTMGDSMVYKLVQWTRTLPMLADLPAEQVTALLENKWHVILLITTSVYRAMYMPLSSSAASSSSPPDSPQRHQQQKLQQAVADSSTSNATTQSQQQQQSSSSSSAATTQAAASSSSSASSSAAQQQPKPAQQQHPRKAALLAGESRGLPSPPLSTDSSHDGLAAAAAGSPRAASAPSTSSSAAAAAVASNNNNSNNSSSSSTGATATLVTQQQRQLATLKARTVDDEFNDALEHLRMHLGRLLQKTLTIDELVRDIGGVLRQLVLLVHALRQLDLSREEYVVLKVLLMLQDVQAASVGEQQPTTSAAGSSSSASSSSSARMRAAYQRYLRCFMAIAERKHGAGCGALQRVQLLFGLIPYVQSAASLLLQHKMFYVPFLLNS